MGKEVVKLPCHPDYPPEEGRYLRGNDYSPVAVVCILNCDEDKIPPEIDAMVRAGLEGGASLSGTLQTPSIGLEKVICNIVANPNIRYIILAGPESEGHLTGDALKALLKNGVDQKKRIIGTDALHPWLYNIPIEFVERFRQQLSLIDLQFKSTPELIKKAVWSCIQEHPTDFMEYKVYDMGAYPEPPICKKITDRVMEPWNLPQDKGEQKAVEKMLAFIKRLKSKRAK